MRSLLLLTGLACAQPPTAEPADPLLRIVGSETVNEALMPALVAGHQEISGALRFEVAGGGSTAGFRALLDGRADIGAGSRLPLPSETEQAQVYGWDFERHLIGLNVVTVQVHPQNPLESLTYTQVRQIFCNGHISDWSELGLEAGKINVLVRDRRSGTRAAFEDFFCGTEGVHPGHTVTDSATMASAVTNDPTAVIIAPLSGRKGKVLALRPRDDAEAVAPTQANVLRGRYPLTHDIALYTPGAPTPEAAAFIGWVVSPLGQQVIEQTEAVPLHLRPERLTGPRPLRETVLFGEQGVAPDDRSKARLAVLESELRERAGEIDHVIIEGFADAGEHDPLRLSYARAESVRDHLAESVPALFFEIIPRGATRPAGPVDTPLGKAQNRRVQVYFAQEEAPRADTDTILGAGAG